MNETMSNFFPVDQQWTMFFPATCAMTTGATFSFLSKRFLGGLFRGEGRWMMNHPYNAREWGTNRGKHLNASRLPSVIDYTCFSFLHSSIRELNNLGAWIPGIVNKIATDGIPDGFFFIIFRWTWGTARKNQHYSSRSALFPRRLRFWLCGWSRS